MSLPYNFQKFNNLNYEFITDNNIRYTVYFIESQFCNITNTSENKVFEFGFDKFEGGKLDSNSNFDPRVKLTIEFILEEFFKDNDNVILYLCYTGDGFQAARNKLFDQWFRQKGNAVNLSKYDAEFITEGDIYFTSLILKIDNPFHDDYKTSFYREVEYFDSLK